VRRPSNALPSRFGISLVVPSGSQVGWHTHSFHIPLGSRLTPIFKGNTDLCFCYRWI
jgi:hypothetical protein